MSVLEHWDVYACPGECIGRSGLWNVAPRDMTCPNCGGTVESMRVYQQPQGAVAENKRLRQEIMLARERLDALPISPRLIIARDGLDAALDGGQ